MNSCELSFFHTPIQLSVHNKIVANFRWKLSRNAIVTTMVYSSKGIFWCTFSKLICWWKMFFFFCDSSQLFKDHQRNVNDFFESFNAALPYEMLNVINWTSIQIAKIENVWHKNGILSTLTFRHRKSFHQSNNYFLSFPSLKANHL